MWTVEQRDRCQQVLRNPGNKTRSELCRELGVSYLELSRIVTELGVTLPPAKRDPDRMKVPRETLEDLVRRGLNRSQIQIALGLSNRGLMRLLRDYHLEVLSPAQRNRQLEAQGLRCCIECRQIKALATDFYNDRTNPLGKNRRCKECLNRWSVRQRHHSKQVPAEERKKRYPWATQGLRRCRRCHKIKPLLTEFPESPNERAGRSVCCHACHEARSQEQETKRHEQELVAQGLRRCCRCHEVKLLEKDFGVNRRDPMGRQSRCRDCQREVTQREHRPVGVARAAGQAVPGGAGLSSLTSLPPGFLPAPQPSREDRPLHPPPSEPARESTRGDAQASLTAQP